MKMFELFNGLCCLPFLLFWFITPGKIIFQLSDTTVHVKEIINVVKLQTSVLKTDDN